MLFGTMDTWLIWKLTGAHVTDVTNASRTMLMNLATLDWDDDAAGRDRRPARHAAGDPAVVARSTARRAARWPACRSPRALGDQQAALFGQTCFSPGEAQVHLRHRQLPAAQHRRPTPVRRANAAC